MIEYVIPDFNIDQIARSGQCFRFRREGKGRYSLIAGGKWLDIEQNGENVRFSCTENEFEGFWRDYFDLNADYGRYKSKVAKRDAYLRAAVETGSGLRILRQELWETIICFIISQQNNIPRITKCVDGLCTLFGEARQNENGEVYHAFPTAERLAQCTPEELSPIRLGYRAKYICATARQVASGAVDLEKVARMKYADAKNKLLRLTGVGIKVAECICLFGLHHIDAFPIDTHIRQMLDAHYPKGFPLTRYRGFAGVMQQYAFFYELEMQNNR